MVSLACASPEDHVDAHSLYCTELMLVLEIMWSLWSILHVTRSHVEAHDPCSH